MNLWLHIGTPKTGSSSIQSFLFDNRSELAKYGLVPLIPGPRQASANRLASAIGGRAKFDAAEVAAHCFECARREAPRDAILSSEEFYLNDPAKIARTLAPYIAEHDAKVHIVLYLRRQDLFIDSFYSHRRKTGRYRGTLKDFILGFAARELNYVAMIDLWRAAFPQATLHLRRFERARFPDGDLINDFMQVIGHPDLAAKFDRSETMNSSPNRDVIALMDMLGETGAFNTRRIYRLLEAAGIPDTGARKSFMDKDTRTTLLNHYAKGNEALRAQYFPQDETLFDMTVPETDPRPETTLTPDMQRLLQSLFQAMAKA